MARGEDELDEEIQAHCEMAERDRTERGETLQAAPRTAEFGNVLLTKKDSRQWIGWLDQLTLDLRCGAQF